jgi:hypothetical protein
MVLRRDKISLLKKPKSTDSARKFSEADIIKMLEVLIDNIFAMFGERQST